MVRYSGSRKERLKKDIEDYMPKNLVEFEKKMLEVGEILKKAETRRNT